MKEKILSAIIIILLVIVATFFITSRQNVDFSGVDTDNNTYRSDIASSSVITVTTDARVLATSTNVIYRRIVNNCSSNVFISDASDSPASTTNGFLLAKDGGEWESNNHNFTYTGSVRASSTNETSCDLHVIEY